MSDHELIMTPCPECETYMELSFYSVNTYELDCDYCGFYRLHDFDTDKVITEGFNDITESPEDRQRRMEDEDYWE